jgi:soluble lytic murein transglycosylase-like protein
VTARLAREIRGQVAILLVGGLMAVGAGAVVLGAFAAGLGGRDTAQRAADLGALAGARAMHDAYDRLFEPARLGGRPNPRHLDKPAYVALGRAAAIRVARANGAARAEIRFPDADTIAPVRIRVDVRRRIAIGGTGITARSDAEAELAPPAGTGELPFATGGGYSGPLAYRQGKPMRPDVAQAFDRMARAAAADGVALVIGSAFRSDAEQAVLFARHPDPKWVARPGTSLHRNGTELDIGPAAVYPWLAANAPRFHFVQRYSWEPWHYGYVLNPRSAPRSTAARTADGERAGGLPDFVPERFAPAINAAAQRWSVSAVLLSAQLYAESGFNPFATSPVGAQGIAQFMPATAHGMGLADPFDPDQAIDAQAHLMRDLLRQFGTVPLALAAYNAGPAPVSGCGCVPAFPETRGYVARILGLMGGAGEGLTAGATAGLAVRLIR